MNCNPLKQNNLKVFLCDALNPRKYGTFPSENILSFFSWGSDLADRELPVKPVSLKKGGFGLLILG